MAVLGVLFYHLGVRHFGGGFVGVDVFFVISGYLITSILIREMDAGSFSFVRFYERRIRRIFPALIAVALASLIVFSVLLAPNDLVAFAQSLMAMCGFSSNIYFANLNQHLGYFDWAANEQALLHTWSLAVEEQFYFCLPILLLLIQKFARRLRGALLLVFALASFTYGARALTSDPTTTYFSFPARGWELLIGALLAGEGIWRIHSRVARELLGGIGAGLILYAILVFNRQTPFPGPYALVPCLGAACILHSGRDGDSVVKSILSFKPAVFVGVISFSLYLWHWPVLAAVRYFRSDRWFSPNDTLILTGVSLLLAFLSFEFIETPFRGSNPLFNRKRIFVFGIGANIALAAAGMLLVLLHGVPQRFSPNVRALVEQNEARMDEWPKTANCSNWRNPIHQFTDAHFCEIGHAGKNILFAGDSMIEQLYPLLTRYRDENALQGRGIVTAIGAGCPPLVHMNHTDAGFYCDRLAQYTLERARKDDIDTVFIQFSPWWTEVDGALCLTDQNGCVRSLTRDEEVQLSIEQLAAQIAELREAHKKVLLGLTYPYYIWPIPQLMEHNAIFSRFHQERLAQERNYLPYNKLEEQVAQRYGISTYDPRTTLCPDNTCIYQVNGVSLYRDGGHLAATQVGILHDDLLKALNAAR